MYSLFKFNFVRMFETARRCTLTRDLVCSMITISENAAPMTTMKLPSVKLQDTRVSGFSFLNNGDLQHQHNQCECWNITKRDVFKLISNILTHQFGRKYSWFFFSFQNSKFTLILSRAQKNPQSVCLSI